MLWVNECWRASKLEELDSEKDRFQSLNGKLFTGLMAMLAKVDDAKQIVFDIGKELQRYAKDNKYFSGRHAAFMIADAFKAFDRQEVYIDIGTIARLKVMNNDLKNF